MVKINKSFAILSLLLIVQPKSEAQLNGEYTYDIANIFSKTITTTTFKGDASRLYITSLGNVFFMNDGYLEFCSAWSHDPKTGQIKGSGQAGVNFSPSDANQSIDASESIEITKSKSILSGKTYTDKSGVARIDFSQTTQLEGTYFTANGEALKFNKGLITFSTKGTPIDAFEGPGNPLKIKGSFPLRGGKIKRLFEEQYDVNLCITGYDLPYSDSYRTDPDLGYDLYASLYIGLNLSTSNSKVSGTATIYYKSTTDWTPASSSADEEYIYPNDDGYIFAYMVSGISKNGISTLTLKGTGKIAGLKAVLYVDESSEEIIQNGKNSITLYGQTITY